MTKPTAVRKRRNIAFRVNDARYAQLAALAQGEQRSISETIELILDRHFEREVLERTLRRVLAERDGGSASKIANSYYVSTVKPWY